MRHLVARVRAASLLAAALLAALPAAVPDEAQTGVSVFNEAFPANEFAEAQSAPGLSVYNQAPAVDGLGVATNGRGMTIYNRASPLVWGADFQPSFRLSVRNTGLSLALTSPNAGDSWRQLTSHDITWTWTGDPGQVKVHLYKGGAWLRTIASQTPNDGLFQWHVPPDLAAASDYAIRVQAVAYSFCWAMSPRFSIARADSGLQVDWPNGKDSVQRGTTMRILWTKWGSPGAQVKINLYRGRNKWLRTISSSTANDGEFSWAIPSNLEPRSDYRIKITSVPLPQYYDLSDNDFSIIAKNAVRAPWWRY